MRQDEIGQLTVELDEQFEDSDRLETEAKRNLKGLSSMFEFQEVSIGDVCSVGDGAHSKVERTDTGVPYLTSKNIGNGVLKLDKLDYISEESFEKLFPLDSKATRRPRPGDVLFGIIGTFGNTYLFKPNDHFGFSSSIGILRPDPEKLSSVYLYYVLSSDAFKSNHASHNAGSVQGYTNIPTVKGLKIPLPSLIAQRKIGDILQSLDAKISCNHQINQTLEQIAQALFKSWFVDFEPVKAKIAAKARWQAAQPSNESASPVCYADELEPQANTLDLETTMNLAAMQAISGKDQNQLAQMEAEQPEQYAQLQATAALFPSAMQENELGEIPEGWEISTIGEEVKVAGGGTPPTKNPDFWENGTVHWTSPKDLSGSQDKVMISTERRITREGLAKISSGLLPVNTVLMSSRAPVGYLALTKIPVAINQGYIAMICTRRLGPEYVLQWANSVMDDIQQRASGTTFAEISKKNFKIIPLVIPPADLVARFVDVAAPHYSAIERNLRNSKDLTEVRDSLLPKLLSGELEI